jgi:hypothetical protein
MGPPHQDDRQNESAASHAMKASFAALAVALCVLAGCAIGLLLLLVRACAVAGG